jgi:PAS domain S-box-containing protein
MVIEKMGQKTRKELLQKIKELELECNLLKKEREKKGSYEKYMREILNNISAPIFLKDAQGRYIMINKKYEELAHITLADISGKNDFDIFPQPVASLFRSQDEEVIQKGITCEFEETIPLADGIHTYITSKFPLRGKDAVISAVGGFCTDITEKKLAEVRLLNEKNFLDSLLKSLPGVMYLFDESGRFLMWNDLFEKVTGYSGEEIKKMHPLDFITSDDKDKVSKAIEKSFKEKNAVVYARFFSRNGEEIPYHFTGISFTADGSNYIVGMGIDISSQIKSAKEKESLIIKLQDALSKVKLLSGLLPICASCKKIRDDNGYWNKIETYLKKHSGAEFTHSICPGCAQKLYPDLVDFDDNKEL